MERAPRSAWSEERAETADTLAIGDRGAPASRAIREPPWLAAGPLTILNLLCE
jgi:hypothetical protein